VKVFKASPYLEPGITKQPSSQVEEDLRAPDRLSLGISLRLLAEDRL
jgi:hypothetical protein